MDSVTDFSPFPEDIWGNIFDQCENSQVARLAASTCKHLNELYWGRRWNICSSDASQLSRYLSLLLNNDKADQLSAFLRAKEVQTKNDRCDTPVLLLITRVPQTFSLFKIVQTHFSNISLRISVDLDDSHVKTLVASLPDVKALHLHNCRRISTSCLEELSYPSEVREISLVAGIYPAQAVLKQISKLCTKLEKFYMMQPVEVDFPQTTYPQSLRYLTVIQWPFLQENNDPDALWSRLWTRETRKKFVASSQSEIILNLRVPVTRLFRNRILSEVIPDLKQVITAYPEDSLAVVCFAAYVVLFAQKSEFETAKKYLDELCKVEPSNQFAKVVSACLLEDTEKETAKTKLQEALAQGYSTLLKSFVEIWSQTSRKGPLAETVIGQFYTLADAGMSLQTLENIQQFVKKHKGNILLQLMYLKLFNKGSEDPHIDRQKIEELEKDAPLVSSCFPQLRESLKKMKEYQLHMTQDAMKEFLEWRVVRQESLLSPEDLKLLMEFPLIFY
jgi:hypothetical protein